MSMQMLARCKRCGKPLNRDNVSVFDDELCRECEKKEWKEKGE